MVSLSDYLYDVIYIFFRSTVVPPSSTVPPVLIPYLSIFKIFKIQPYGAIIAIWGLPLYVLELEFLNKYSVMEFCVLNIPEIYSKKIILLLETHFFLEISNHFQRSSK